MDLFEICLVLLTLFSISALTTMYTIWYIEGEGRVRKTTGDFETLQSIHQNHALAKVQSGGRNVLSTIGGTLEDIKALQDKGLIDS